MGITRYKVNANCYPRYKAASRRISDILRRTYSLWNSTFRVPFPSGADVDEEEFLQAQKIEKDTQDDYLDLFLFDRKGEKQISNSDGTDMLLHNQGISHRESFKYENVNTFLEEKYELLKSTSILIFRDHKYLRSELDALSSQQNIVMVSSKQKCNTLAKTHAQRPNLKVSTVEDIADNIGLLLEIIAFKPLKHKFATLKRVTNETLAFVSQTKKASDRSGHSSGLQYTRSRTGIKRKYDDSAENGTDISATEDSSGVYLNRSQTGTKRKHDDSIDNCTGSYPEYDDRNTRSKMKSKVETRTLQDANLGVVTSDIKHIVDNGKNKFVENKPQFQRILGEMIGMYKRSKIPDDLKPPLDDIPKVTVYTQVLKDLYSISESIQGYAYRFGTRLQILVTKDKIDMLRPAIVQTLGIHSITPDDYDIIPPIKDVSYCKKILTGARVGVGTTGGSLSGFVSMQKGQQREDVCAISAKHVLDGLKKVELTNEKVRITADVIVETAPGDGLMAFDIAAAKIRTEDKMHCEGKFRNESGGLMKGMMCSYDDDQLDCQQVYVYGASTGKGKGIVSMTHINKRAANGSNQSKEREETNLNRERKDTDESTSSNVEEDPSDRYIVVEDREDYCNFCKAGDSGAMVCADDEDGNHVQLISTVMGENRNGSYTTFRLTQAIAKLEELTESQMQFLE